MIRKVFSGRRWRIALMVVAAAASAPSRPCAKGEPPNHSASSSPSLVRLTNDGYFKQRPVWSPDGKTLCFARHRGATIFLFLRSADGTQQRRLTTRDAPEYDAVYAPDGKRLAFTLDNASPNQGDLDIYTCNLQGQDLQPVATNADKLSHEEWPSWSPDGRSIAFSSTREGNQEIYVCRVDGADKRRLTSHPAIDAHPAWSPDGAQIAFATNRWGDLELALVNVDGGNLTRLTESKGLDDYPCWSPDGNKLAFTSNRDGNFEIYIANSDGSDLHNVTDSPAIDNFPSWLPDDRLTFVSNRDGGFDVYMLRGGNP